MADPERPPQDFPPRRSRRYRWIVSAFLIVHLTSVLLYIGPTSGEGLEILPDWVARPMVGVTGTVWPVAAPFVDRYFRTFGLSQHWRLFGPRPTQWTTVVKVVAYHPRDPDDPLSRSLWEEAAAAATGIPWPDSVRVDPARWMQDTVRLEWGGGGDFPKFMHQREHRLTYNLGDRGFFDSYGAVFARWQCLQLEGPHGRPPDGIQVLVDWIAVDVPWTEPAPDYPSTFMGGFTCPALLAVEVE